MHSSIKTSMLRIQATPTCNLNCSYCYIPEEVRKRKGNMDFSLLKTLIQRLVDEDLLEDKLAISWHGAEPLVPGISWYEKAFAIIRSVIGDKCQVQHIFQSNGTLLNDDWCVFLKKYQAQIGVSIDGSVSQNAQRVNWSGVSSYPKTVAGIHYLNKHEIPWVLLAVVTNETMSDPKAFVDFVLSTDCSMLGFKVEETNVVNISKISNQDSAIDTYADFLQYLWDNLHKTGLLRVREFEGIIHNLEGETQYQAVPVTLIPFRNLTVGTNGDFTIFSGELVFRNDDKFVFGNVLDGPLLDCLTTQKFEEVSSEILKGVHRCRDNCEYYDRCGSFFISQKYSEYETFDSEETLACKFEIKAFYEAMQSNFQEMDFAS